MKARAIALALLVAVSPITAQAAWFCGDEPSKFARWRTESTLNDVEIRAQSIVAGSGSFVVLCVEDNQLSDRSCTIQRDPDQTDWKARVDAYKAKVDDMMIWAESLQDGCLRDAYKGALKIHQKQIEEDYRAIEFMKGPQPLAPNS